jgi:hypothetical protein
MRRCSKCNDMKHDIAFKGIHTDMCRLCSYDERDKSSPHNGHKSLRKCLNCDKDFMASMNKRLCDPCKSNWD